MSAFPPPSAPLADRVAAMFAECDAARVREVARQDRIEAIQRRPVPRWQAAPDLAAAQRGP